MMKCPACSVTTLRYIGYQRVFLNEFTVKGIRYAHHYTCRNLLCGAAYIKVHGRLVPGKKGVE